MIAYILFAVGLPHRNLLFIGNDTSFKISSIVLWATPKKIWEALRISDGSFWSTGWWQLMPAGIRITNFHRVTLRCVTEMNALPGPLVSVAVAVAIVCAFFLFLAHFFVATVLMSVVFAMPILTISVGSTARIYVLEACQELSTGLRIQAYVRCCLIPCVDDVIRCTKYLLCRQ